MRGGRVRKGFPVREPNLCRGHPPSVLPSPVPGLHLVPTLLPLPRWRSHDPTQSTCPLVPCTTLTMPREAAGLSDSQTLRGAQWGCPGPRSPGQG